MAALTEARRVVVPEARRVVVKIGSALLVDRVTGDLRRSWLDAIAEKKKRKWRKTLKIKK